VDGWIGVGLKNTLRYPFTMIDESLLAKVASLSPADRLELIGAVWDTLSLDDLPVSDAERALLHARLADMERNPDDQSPWPEVNARLEQARRSR
jgi:putative addiction module component (TIGR02574 family)